MISFKKILMVTVLALPGFGFSAEAYEVCSVEMTHSDEVGYSVYAVCDGVVLYGREGIREGYITEFTKAMAEALSKNRDFRVLECEIEDQERVCIIGRK